jgi:hypothetical protein
MTALLTRSPRVRGWLIMAGIGILLISLAWGLIVFLWSIAAGTGSPSTPSGSVTGTSPVLPTPTPAGDVVEAQRDRLAAEPMLSVPLAAARPQPLDPAGGPTMVVPAATDPGASLPTGFPRTPAGAVAALAAINTAAFAGLNPATAATVHRQAALPGAVGLDAWSPAVGVGALLRAAGAPNGSPEITGTWILTHAQVKGVLEDGDFVVACVLGELTASYRTVERVGIGDCQRMLWSSARWWIAPGAQPAYPPSTWPGSADCVRAGWMAVRRA